ncbi:transglycosylase [Candidatus Berkelbacteria bacterium CG10_big_fil_rev_8_21_14_0_10_43_13]|uniref:Transglycosylase n=1 Tax=Candidatus Berkelbacteria bacterium CG10_big_fil_rev_8_21_14_0_10_43_13 TaxID=1974514 RepID=A0A2H0W6Z2_9BACT|nr:MAG: transglycosylase [Candidatus Berkelbacteria bacterium CG10_big_fil_rev_8_21_14_0_10_43_13]
MANKKRKNILTVLILLLTVAGSIYFYLPKMLADEVYPLEYADLIKANATKYSVDPALVCGVIFQESRFDPNARSSTGARGLMQMITTTAQTMAEETGYPSKFNLYDPTTSIEFGTAHLRDLLVRYDGNIDYALAAYNLGGGGADALLRSRGSQAVSSLRYVVNAKHYQTVYATMYATELGLNSSPVQLTEGDVQTKQAEVRGYFWVQLFQNIFHF